VCGVAFCWSCLGPSHGHSFGPCARSGDRDAVRAALRAAAPALSDAQAAEAVAAMAAADAAAGAAAARRGLGAAGAALRRQPRAYGLRDAEQPSPLECALAPLGAAAASVRIALAYQAVAAQLPLPSLQPQVEAEAAVDAALAPLRALLAAALAGVAAADAADAQRAAARRAAARRVEGGRAAAAGAAAAEAAAAQRAVGAWFAANAGLDAATADEPPAAWGVPAAAALLLRAAAAARQRDAAVAAQRRAAAAPAPAPRAAADAADAHAAVEAATSLIISAAGASLLSALPRPRAPRLIFGRNNTGLVARLRQHADAAARCASAAAAAAAAAPFARGGGVNGVVHLRDLDLYAGAGGFDLGLGAAQALRPRFGGGAAPRLDAAQQLVDMPGFGDADADAEERAYLQQRDVRVALNMARMAELRAVLHPHEAEEGEGAALPELLSDDEGDMEEVPPLVPAWHAPRRRLRQLRPRLQRAEAEALPELVSDGEEEEEEADDAEEEAAEFAPWQRVRDEALVAALAAGAPAHDPDESDDEAGPPGLIEASDNESESDDDDADEEGVVVDDAAGIILQRFDARLGEDLPALGAFGAGARAGVLHVGRVGPAIAAFGAAGFGARLLVEGADQDGFVVRDDEDAVWPAAAAPVAAPARRVAEPAPAVQLAAQTRALRASTDALTRALLAAAAAGAAAAAAEGAGGGGGSGDAAVMALQ
jgi:hypothetical protein